MVTRAQTVQVEPTEHRAFLGLAEPLASLVIAEPMVVRAHPALRVIAEHLAQQAELAELEPPAFPVTVEHPELQAALAEPALPAPPVTAEPPVPLGGRAAQEPADSAEPLASPAPLEQRAERAVRRMPEVMATVA